MSWLARDGERLVLNLRVVPRASRSEIAGTMGDALKIRLQAPPVDGKANKALVKFLAERLSVPARGIALLSGDTSRTKRIAVTGLSEAELRSRLSS